MVLASSLLTLVPAVPPKVTVGLPTKSDPLIVTDVPPVFSTFPGVTEATVGGLLYVNPFAFVPVVLSGFITTTFTAPALCAGVVAMMVVESTTWALVADVPPKVIVVLLLACCALYAAGVVVPESDWE